MLFKCCFKKTIADTMIEQACKLYPQIRDHIDYIEIGTPVTNSHYLGQPHGEIYGLDHGYGRFDPWMMAQLRQKTDIPGLYLTGKFRDQSNIKYSRRVSW